MNRCPLGTGAFEDFQLRRKTNGKSEQFHILSADFVNYVGEMAFQLSNSFGTSDPSSDPDEVRRRKLRHHIGC